MTHRFSFAFLPLLLAAFFLSACGLTSGADIKAQYPEERTQGQDPYQKKESVFGEGGIGLFGNKKKAEQGTGLGVNAFLWRGALDTISFMPMTAADPFGGTIITDWYAPESTPNERFKANVFILDTQLRADAVRVTLFRQIKGKNGGWQDAAIDKSAQTDLEDAILTRARQLRVQQNPEK